MSPGASTRSRWRRWARRCNCFRPGNDVIESDPPPRPTSVAKAPIVIETSAHVGVAGVASNENEGVEKVSEDASQPGCTPPAGFRLWDKALDHVIKSERDPQIVATFQKLSNQSNEEAGPGELGTLQGSAKDINKAMEQEIAGRGSGDEVHPWNIAVGANEYSVRVSIDNAISILDKFVLVGDAAVSIDPVHAALPCAAVRFVVMSLNSQGRLSSEITLGLAKVITLMFQCAIYQKLYNSQNGSLESQIDILEYLEDIIVQAYVKSLLFLSFALRKSDGSVPTAVLELDDVEAHVQNLLNIGNELIQAADNCESYCQHQNESDVEEILQLVRESHQEIHGQGEKSIEIPKYTLLPDLPHAEGAAYDSHSDEYDVKCHMNTRVELLENIQNWAHDPDGERIFWLQGIAGTGKSTVARTLAQKLDRSGHLGASFFFKRGDGDRSHAGYFFTTISKQLCDRRPEFSEYVKKVVNDDPSITTGAMAKQFEKLITEPLNVVNDDIEDPLRIVVVIDAMDECDNDEDVRRIIIILSQQATLSKVDLRFLITSRPDHHVTLGFDHIGEESYQNAALHTIPQPVIQQDISNYLKHELSIIKDKHNVQAFGGAQLPNEWPSEEDVQRLVGMTVPLFISAATVCRFLADGPPSDPADKLSRILKYPAETYDDKLVATYAPVLERLVAGKTDSQKTAVIEDFRNIVGPIVLFAEPLSISSLAQLLDINPRTVSGFLRSLHPVLRVPLNTTSPVRTFHSSLREFLVNKNRIVHEFWVDEENTHTELASKCLGLLSGNDNLRYDMCNLGMAGKSRKEISPEVLNSSLSPEVQYACLYWIHHLKEGKVILDDKHQAHQFLRSYFLHWLEALSLMGKISETNRLIGELQNIIEPAGGVQMLEFLHDAKHILLRFCAVIDDAPLQVYSSALPFVPQKSIIRDIFQGQIDWVPAQPTMEHHWGACLLTLCGHTKNVDCVAYSQDGRWIASGGVDGKINIWDATTGKLQHTHILGNEEEGTWVLSLGFSGDSRMLASALYSGIVHIWDTITGQLLRTLQGQGEPVRSVSFSADGTLLASGSDDKTAKIWDVTTGELRHTLNHRKQRADSVAFAVNGNMMVSGATNGMIRIWDSTTGKRQNTLEGHTSVVDSIAFAPDGDLIVSGSTDETIKVWNTATGAIQHTINCHCSVSSVAFSDDGKKFVAGLNNKTIVIYDATTGRIQLTLHGHTNTVNSISFSPGSNLIVSVSSDKTVKVWDITKETAQQSLEGHADEVNKIAFSDDGELMASGSDDQTVKIWDPTTGAVRDTLLGHIGAVRSVSFFATGKLLAVASRNGTLKVYDATKGTIQFAVEAHIYFVNSVALSPDSRLLAFESGGRTIKVWDIMEGKLHLTLKGHTNGVSAVAFSPDCTLLASGAWDFNVKLWNTATGTIKYTLRGHTYYIHNLVFSSDSKLLASVSDDKTIKIWDTTKGVLQQTLEIGFIPTTLSFTPDGSHLLVEPCFLQIEIASGSSSRRIENEVHYSLNAEYTWIQSNGKNFL